MRREIKPGWQPLAVKCCKCMQGFRAWIPTNVQMAYAAATLQATTCPMCGASSSNIVFDLEAKREGGAP